jgi:hypothetical protein
MNGTQRRKTPGRTAAAGVVVVLVAGSLCACSFFKPKPKKQFGEDCTSPFDCDSMQCSTYGSICTKDCTYDKDCGADLVCRGQDTGTGSQCSKAMGNPPGAACMVATECAHDHCLKQVGKEDQPGFCSKFCSATDDCAAGFKVCEAISDSGALKMCLPGDPSTPASQRPQYGAAAKGGAAPAKPAAQATPAAASVKGTPGGKKPTH